MTHFIIDLDDTLANTTRDLEGDVKRIRSLTLVEGAKEFLERHGSRCVLLSAGVWRDQHHKLDVLGVGKYFQSVMIMPTPEDKVRQLGIFVSSFGPDLSQVVVVGDRLDIEIRAGNSLGCTTVRMCLPEGKHARVQPDKSLGEVPRYTVSNFRELLQLFSGQ